MNTAKKIEFAETMQIADLSQKTFERLVRRLYQIAGIHLPFTEKNISLVRNRLSKILRKEGLGSFEALAERMENPSRELLEQFISSLTTNKTHFFREEAHFHFLKEQLATHFQTHPDLRVWCAASSTGQEPYTLAMVVKESVPQAQLRNCRILATDIDLEVLQKAVDGVYTEAEIEGVPSWLRTKYFDSAKGSGVWRAKDDLADLIHFSRFNLVQGPYQFKKPFHFIFCRNVLIYFDPETTKKVIANLASCVEKGGYLILGHSESGTVNDPQIKAMSQATYRKL